MIDAHDLAGGFHFRPQQDIHIGKTVERENGLFDGDMLRPVGFGKPQFLQRFPQHDLVASFASGTPMALLTKGTVREARGLTSST